MKSSASRSVATRLPPVVAPEVTYVARCDSAEKGTKKLRSPVALRPEERMNFLAQLTAEASAMR